VIKHKYFLGDKKACCDSPTCVRGGSTIWKLMIVISPMINDHLTWLPNNGTQINIWKILGFLPLGKTSIFFTCMNG